MHHTPSPALVGIAGCKVYNNAHVSVEAQRGFPFLISDHLLLPRFDLLV